jgi:hypothetical protein
VRQSAVDQIDQQVRRDSLVAMPKEIRLLDDILLHMNHGIVPLSGVTNDRGLDFLAMLLLHRAFGSLWRAREDAVCGYPVQSLTLCRAALEDWGTLCYIERHPETRNLWLRDVLEEIEASGREPRFKDIWSDLGKLGERPDEAYGVLSLFSHPRGRGLPWLYHADAKTTYFHVGGRFDQHDLSVCLYFLVTVAQPFLERIAQLQFRVLGDAVLEWVQQGNELTKEASAFLDRIHAQILQDLEAAGVSGSETRDG